LPFAKKVEVRGLKNPYKKRRASMKKAMMNFRIPLVFAVLMIPAVVEAESINVWPDQLKPVNPTVAYMQSVDEARNGLFYAPIYLRVGAKIVKVTYYHLGARSPALTAAKLMRVKMGEVPQKLADKSSSDSTGEIIPVDVPITGESVVKPDYRYYLSIESSNDNSFFMGAKVTYH